MLRACLVLVLLAGCDDVLGLEREGHDDDGDGAPDDVDPCPHIAGQSEVDKDGDGISADCDVNDAVATPRREFWTFLDGQLPPEIRLDKGSAIPDPDAEAIILGQHADGLHLLVVDVVTDTALIDIGFEILGNAIDDDTSMPSYAELGVYAVHRAFEQGNLTMRGDVCYFGRNLAPGGVYLELNEDEASRNNPVQIPGPLSGVAGRMRVKRAPARLDCVVARPTGDQSSDGFDVMDKTRTGKLAISAERVRARVTYVWISRP